MENDRKNFILLPDADTLHLCQHGLLFSDYAAVCALSDLQNISKTQKTEYKKER